MRCCPADELRVNGSPPTRTVWKVSTGLSTATKTALHAPSGAVHMRAGASSAPAPADLREVLWNAPRQPCSSLLWLAEHSRRHAGPAVRHLPACEVQDLGA